MVAWNDCLHSVFVSDKRLKTLVFGPKLCEITTRAHMFCSVSRFILLRLSRKTAFINVYERGSYRRRAFGRCPYCQARSLFTNAVLNDERDPYWRARFLLTSTVLIHEREPIKLVDIQYSSYIPSQIPHPDLPSAEYPFFRYTSSCGYLSSAGYPYTGYLLYECPSSTGYLPSVRYPADDGYPSSSGHPPYSSFVQVWNDICWIYPSSAGYLSFCSRQGYPPDIRRVSPIQIAGSGGRWWVSWDENLKEWKKDIAEGWDRRRIADGNG